MKQLGIDVRMAYNSGIGRYIRGLTSALSPNGQDWQYFFLGSRKFKNDFPMGNYIPLESSIYSISEQFSLPFVSRHFDCLHIPHYNVPVLWKRKLVVTIHDLIHLKFAKGMLAHSYAKMMLSYATKKADAIIAVSENTKTDLIKKLNVPAKKITVIYHGVDPFFLNSEESEKRSFSEPFFLYVGMIKAHKNLGTLLKAFVKIRQNLQMNGLKLRILGFPDRRQKIVRQWLDFISREPSILLETNSDDQTLKSAYRHATAIIVPSLYEGFGFPLIEAMACKTPIVASRASSLPEIAGQAALYFDPHSVAELQACIEKLLLDKTQRERLISFGSERIKIFNWQTAAKKTEQIYDAVIHGN